MAAAVTTTAVCRNFIGEKWVESSSTQFLERCNPSNTDGIVARVPPSIMLPVVFLLLVFVLLPCAFAANKPIIWKPDAMAILEVKGRKPPKNWSVWEDEKKKERVLVQLDNLYLVIDAKTKQVFELPAGQLQPHGKNFQSVDPSESQRALPSTDWDMRDLGPAERIEVRLTDDNTLLDVQLPHPLNLRVPLH